MTPLADLSVDLIVTSPPYPMIDMWDGIFSDLCPDAKQALAAQDGPAAFEAMHTVLDRIWQECHRVLKPGGFACINIGDATRTVNGIFRLYPNHARILSCAGLLGFSVLPCILWRKQTNAPNKYMGSGMLPAGAYVTLEHEYILILRKGDKRVFTEDKALRRESALFWEERNLWFSDVWMDLKGQRQNLKGQKALRNRSGAFPLELPLRLVNMYSAKGDTVLDPFAGTCTTTVAAMACARSSIGMDLDAGLLAGANERFRDIADLGREIAEQRRIRHRAFVDDRVKTHGPLKHVNQVYGFPVMTAQEKELMFSPPVDIRPTGDLSWEVEHAPLPHADVCCDNSERPKKSRTKTKVSEPELPLQFSSTKKR